MSSEPMHTPTGGEPIPISKMGDLYLLNTIKTKMGCIDQHLYVSEAQRRGLIDKPTYYEINEAIQKLRR